MKIQKIVLAAAAILLIGQGCPISFTGGGGGNDGGIYRSSDKGVNWVQKGAVLSVGAARSLVATDVLTIVADPQDAATVYIGTAANGLFYTTDAGESWAQPKALSGARIAAVSVDHKNKCVVYAVSGTVAVKTTDCTRTWAKTFEDTRPDSSLASITVDHFNPSIVYIGSSKGDVLKSTDAGASWVPIKVFTSPVGKVLVDPFDSRVLYAGTRSAGVWKSTDAGATWVDVSTDLAQFDGAKDFYDLVPDRSRRDSYLLASRYGLNRTVDGGAHWEKVTLLTPPGQARIYSIATNPQNGQEIYYATATIFYRSTDGGVNWTTKRLPTTRAGSALHVDAGNPAVIYLGTLKLKK